MRLKNGNRFRIECEDPETITYVLGPGTVDKVATDLDGQAQMLARGEELTFDVSKAQPRRLVVTYLFKSNSGESYEATVTGSAGGDDSVDDFQQHPNEASKSRRYTFDV
ncbi:MAG TPA: hypothetical protein VFE33_20260 [Thermoanaerobaculia bacterium]|nr:hypothetical protein [Thermoanaerobaculia bacterium]